MTGDKAFKKAEGMESDEKMENERGQTTIGEEGDHGWAPDSGKTSAPNKQAGDKAFDPSNAAPTEKGDSASARPAN
jgi:hypothetical protein